MRAAWVGGRIAQEKLRRYRVKRGIEEPDAYRDGPDGRGMKAVRLIYDYLQLSETRLGNREFFNPGAIRGTRTEMGPNTHFIAFWIQEGLGRTVITGIYRNGNTYFNPDLDHSPGRPEQYIGRSEFSSVRDALVETLAHWEPGLTEPNRLIQIILPQRLD
jgi:hypothetical protein